MGRRGTLPVGGEAIKLSSEWALDPAALADVELSAREALVNVYFESGAVLKSRDARQALRSAVKRARAPFMPRCTLPAMALTIRAERVPQVETLIEHRASKEEMRLLSGKSRESSESVVTRL